MEDDQRENHRPIYMESEGLVGNQVMKLWHVRCHCGEWHGREYGYMSKLTAKQAYGRHIQLVRDAKRGRA